MEPHVGALINMQTKITEILRDYADIAPHVQVVRSKKDNHLIRILVKASDTDEFNFLLTKIKIRLFPQKNGLLDIIAYDPPRTGIHRWNNNDFSQWPQRAQLKIVAVTDLESDSEEDMEKDKYRK